MVFSVAANRLRMKLAKSPALKGRSGTGLADL